MCTGEFILKMGAEDRIHAIFQTNPFVQPTFLLQLKKSRKKTAQ